jgi:hypothetical protein
MYVTVETCLPRAFSLCKRLRLCFRAGHPFLPTYYTQPAGTKKKSDPYLPCFTNNFIETGMNEETVDSSLEY